MKGGNVLDTYVVGTAFEKNDHGCLIPVVPYYYVDGNENKDISFSMTRNLNKATIFMTYTEASQWIEHNVRNVDKTATVYVV